MYLGYIIFLIYETVLAVLNKVQIKFSNNEQKVYILLAHLDNELPNGIAYNLGAANKCK